VFNKPKPGRPPKDAVAPGNDPGKA
jgi:hypothetical protein